jgi:DNA-binding PadR family transcriptional regulator
LGGVRQGLSTTSYALLGLLNLDGPDSAGLTGYELKQRADNTLRFYWAAPAMSQVYSELTRLAERHLVAGSEEQRGQRTTLRFTITAAGLETLRDWLTGSVPGFPGLKHPMALRLMMGALTGPDQMRSMLEGYLTELAARRADLDEVRASLVGHPEYCYPALVADWGLHYYDSEAEIVTDILTRLPTTPPVSR